MLCAASATASLNLCESSVENWFWSRRLPPSEASNSSKPTPNRPEHPSNAFDLKQEVAQLFEAVRGVDDGEIRVLEVRGGLPLCMEIAE